MLPRDESASDLLRAQQAQQAGAGAVEGPDEAAQGVGAVAGEGATAGRGPGKGSGAAGTDDVVVVGWEGDAGEGEGELEGAGGGGSMHSAPSLFGRVFSRRRSGGSGTGRKGQPSAAYLRRFLSVRLAGGWARGGEDQGAGDGGGGAGRRDGEGDAAMARGKSGKLVISEERATGSVSGRLYWRYLHLMGPPAVAVLAGEERGT